MDKQRNDTVEYLYDGATQHWLHHNFRAKTMRTLLSDFKHNKHITIYLIGRQEVHRKTEHRQPSHEHCVATIESVVCQLVAIFINALETKQFRLLLSVLHWVGNLLIWREWYVYCSLL